MKQILQNLKNGAAVLVDIPEPGLALVSAGTRGQQRFGFLSLKKGQKHA